MNTEFNNFALTDFKRRQWTKIYLASLETNVIDRANQTLIKLLEA